MARDTVDRYRASNAMLERALKVVPLGSQTFSKSWQQFPEGAAPLFLKRGEGCRVWDVDGNEYVDMIAGLLPNVLGYKDPDVDAAIRAQLEDGISFSLATELEIDLAERLVDLIPCAEQVRYGKNGSDATTGCLRVARAATGRDRVIICGYHGWHDWYVAKTVRNKGVPAAVGDLTDRVAFNDLDAVTALFAKHPGEIAAVMIEPMTAAEPKPGYLAELKELAHKHGAVLIFDEIVTGFRFAPGGAQELFGVTPDLAAFGKAMGNGMPIAAVVGRADLMAEMEEVFFSSTFGGETLSLAAAIAVVDKIRREPVVPTLWRVGETLNASIRASVERHGLDDAVHLSGAACWTLLGFSDAKGERKEAIKTFFIREMLAGGVLVAAANNVMYAHGADDEALTRVVSVYDAALGALAEELARGGLEERLGCPPIMPVFSVRETAPKR